MRLRPDSEKRLRTYLASSLSLELSVCASALFYRGCGLGPKKVLGTRGGPVLAYLIQNVAFLILLSQLSHLGKLRGNASPHFFDAHIFSLCPSNLQELLSLGGDEQQGGAGTSRQQSILWVSCRACPGHWELCAWLGGEGCRRVWEGLPGDLGAPRHACC